MIKVSIKSSGAQLFFYRTEMSVYSTELSCRM